MNFFWFPGSKIAYPEKKTPGSKWVVWLSTSAKNCDRPCEEKKKGGDLNAENASLEISASFIKITETKISCVLWEEDIRNFVCHGKNKY